MKSIRKFQVMAMAAIIATGLAACGGGTTETAAAGASASSQTDDISANVAVDENARALLPQSVKDKGTLTVAMELKYPPTTFLAEDGRTPIGFNPDMVRLIAKKLGLQLEIVDVGFDTIIPALQGNRYDMTATSMSPTEERVAVVRACRYVDEVVPAGPDVVTLQFVRDHDISVVVHGDDVSDEAIATVYADVAAAGMLRLVPRHTGLSTTELVRRVQDRCSEL
jgi:glycerol-3-phosphate cytidylyltransferase-like family protein